MVKTRGIPQNEALPCHWILLRFTESCDMTILFPAQISAVLKLRSIAKQCGKSMLKLSYRKPIQQPCPLPLCFFITAEMIYRLERWRQGSQ